MNHQIQKNSVSAALVPTAAKKLTKIRASSQPGRQETIQYAVTITAAGQTRGGRGAVSVADGTS